jgi:hypothetical protein
MERMHAANNPFNGFAWSSESGVEIDEREHRMSMVTAYATFEPSRAFRQVLDAAADCARNDGERGGWDYLGYLWDMDSPEGDPMRHQRDFALMVMGL